MPSKKNEGKKLIANNKKAFHDYFVEEQLETGIELFGTEVKSIRAGHCSIKEAYVFVRHGEMFVEGMNVPPYEKGNIFNKDPLRTRRLLAHKKEILKFDQKLKEKGYTLVPLEVYFKEGRVKVNIGLAKGKKLYDKRDSIAKKDAKREAERDFKASLKI
ncbi:MAG: SsrA-binding protein SmpB [Lachnospiraceae bacterium]|nr:SsrA-binding protein SmpB [Lachnospiraceae bacterium]